MELQGKRVAVLAENMYQELELWYPPLSHVGAGGREEEQTHAAAVKPDPPEPSHVVVPRKVLKRPLQGYRRHIHLRGCEIAFAVYLDEFVSAIELPQEVRRGGRVQRLSFRETS